MPKKKLTIAWDFPDHDPARGRLGKLAMFLDPVALDILRDHPEPVLALAEAVKAGVLEHSFVIQENLLQVCVGDI